MCCNSDAKEIIFGHKIEASPIGARKLLDTEERELILIAQDNRCFYCLNGFGDYIWYRNKLIQIRINWDHFVPFDYLQSNPDNNWVASCQVCNSIKSNKMFDTTKEAIEYVKRKREEKEPRLRRSKVSKLQSIIPKDKKEAKILQRKLQRESLERQEPKNKIVSGLREFCKYCERVFIITNISSTVCKNCRDREGDFLEDIIGTKRLTELYEEFDRVVERVERIMRIKDKLLKD